MNEANPQNTPPNPQPEGVWLSKEEYERLRHESTHIEESPETIKAARKKNSQAYLAAIAATIIFMCLSFNLVLFELPLAISLIIFSILAIRSLYGPVAAKVGKPATRSFGKTLLIITLIFLIPVTPFILLILFFLYFMLASGGRGS